MTARTEIMKPPSPLAAAATVAALLALTFLIVSALCAMPQECAEHCYNVLMSASRLAIGDGAGRHRYRVFL